MTAVAWSFEEPSAAARAIKDAGVFLVPTLVTYEMISRMGKSLGIPENNVRKIDAAKERVGRTQAKYLEAYERLTGQKLA